LDDHPSCEEPAAFLRGEAPKGAASRVLRHLAALYLLRMAIKMGAAGYALAGLLEDVADFLRRSEHDPEAKFDPRPR
jgi:hypothetical protein